MKSDSFQPLEIKILLKTVVECLRQDVLKSNIQTVVFYKLFTQTVKEVNEIVDQTDCFLFERTKEFSYFDTLLEDEDILDNRLKQIQFEAFLQVVFATFEKINISQTKIKTFVQYFEAEIYRLFNSKVY